eukprot:TRINITY_DN6617_c0_g1_i1.p1 TRINITY_DN6617_c0_g1~~TRINITY_DN6617_c0_g1_i1.p1  ORF type:complete len:204 (+),score=42.47 TRINITY_DN6617_c0_g1_i1:116-727(+)
MATATLRLATSNDAPGIHAIYAPIVEHSYTSFEATPPSPDEMAARIEAVLERYPWLVAEHRGRLLGYAYATPHRGRAGYRWSAEVSVYVAADAQRRGVGRALYAALVALLQAQRVVNLYAGIALPNAASVGLHEALGFVPIARYPKVGYKAGAWHDTGWWHRSINAHDAEPSPPLALSDLDPLRITEALQAGAALLRPWKPAS